MTNCGMKLWSVVWCITVFVGSLASFKPEIKPDLGIWNMPPFCPCSPISICEKKSYQPAKPKDKQVMVVSEGKKTWKNWNWDVITTVISTGPPEQELMCYTYSKGKQYGFRAHLSNYTQMLNDGGHLPWIVNTVQNARKHFADYIALDMLDVFREEAFNVSTLSNFLRELTHSVQSLSPFTKVMCLLPWTPSRLGENHAQLLDNLKKYCQQFMLESKGYLSSDEACKARASIPFTKLVLGVDEFVSQGLPVDNMFLGVPWHGNDYLCHAYDQKKSQCNLQPPPTDGNPVNCNYSRASTRTSLGDMMVKWPDQVERMNRHSWDKFQMAPYFTYNDTKMRTHQVWFEDMHSLIMKYHFSRDVDMAGVVIWSGDDLNYNNHPVLIAYDKLMWNLLKDSMFEARKDNYLLDQFKAFPSKMAGVGIGCMLLGTVLGFVIGAVICTQRHRKTLRPPFVKDHLQEYQDEDPNM